MKVENHSVYDVVRDDANKNGYAESIAANLLRQQYPSCKVEIVADEQEFWHRGDIRVTLPNGTERYIDVKNDGVWGRTGNLNAEDELWKVDWVRYGNGFRDGFMRTASYDGIMYMDTDRGTYLFINFKRWKEEYDKPGNFRVVGRNNDSCGRKVMEHRDSHGDVYETTYGYLNPVKRMIELGVVVGQVWFDGRGEITEIKSY